MIETRRSVKFITVGYPNICHDRNIKENALKMKEVLPSIPKLRFTKSKNSFPMYQNTKHKSLVIQFLKD